MIPANQCPYCGGPYTLSQTCHGVRTETPGENACPEMARHARIVSLAALADVTEADEAERRV